MGKLTGAGRRVHANDRRLAYTYAMNRDYRVLVAMSGGVDSSVAACLLHEQGHDVVGVFMRLGAAEPETVEACAAEGGDERVLRPAGAPDATSGVPAAKVTSGKPVPPDGRGLSLPVRAAMDAVPSDRHRGCCSAIDATDARAVAGRLGIPFYALNFEEDFGRLKRYFADEYAVARTPNPCVMCNQWLKFGRLIEYADAIGADMIATGHYARLAHTGESVRMFRATDAAKDQSYVLFGVDPSILRRTRFPLGELTKSEVRAHARRFDLPVHDKPESQDICFVPDRDYARVVRRLRGDAFTTGVVRHVDGRELARHDGLPNFTIGQRRGLGVAVGEPVYVASLDPQTGEVVVGPQASILSNTAHASRVSWLHGAPTDAFRALVRIRYNHETAPARVEPLPDSQVRVTFDEPQWAVTPGQALVIYDNDEVLGGGWIDHR